MAKVICTLPNASKNINGIQFVTHCDGMISEEIDDDVALALSEIPGYKIHDPGQTDKVAAAVLEAARKKAAAGQGGTPNSKNSKPTAPPAGISSTSPPGGQQTAPPVTGATPPATSPAGSDVPGGEGASKGDTPDPNF